MRFLGDSRVFPFYDRNECVLEDWYVFGMIQGKGKRELIGKSTFKVTLTEPQILFSKRELTFRVDVCPQGDKSQQKGSFSPLFPHFHVLRILLFNLHYSN